MPLYQAPLQLRKLEEVNTRSRVENSLNELVWDYFYSGKRVGASGHIELRVCTIVTEAKTNLYLRHCYYSGFKATWKDAIKEQLKEHLRTIGLEEGLVKSETRYFEVSLEKHLELERYGATIRDLTAKITNSNK